MRRTPFLSLPHQTLPLSQSFNYELLPFCPLINIPHIVRHRLKMTRGIITLTNKYPIAVPALQRFVQWYRWAHEFLFYLAETVQPRLELEMVVGGAFGDGRDDGNVVRFWADIVGGGDDGDINVWMLWY